MTLQMKLMEEREEGHAEGKQEAIFICVQDGDLTISRGAEKLGLSSKEFRDKMIEAGYKLPE